MKESNLYEVEYILKKRTVKGKKEYLIKWKGYPESESTWEPLSHLKYINYMIKEFEQKSKEEREKEREIEKEKEKEKEKKNEEDNKDESTNRNSTNKESIEKKEDTETKTKEVKKEKEEKKEKKEKKEKNKLIGKKRNHSYSKKLEVRISNNKAIFEVDQSLEKILTVKLDNKALIAVVERRLKTGKTLKEIMNTEELKKTNPWILIDYYEGKIKFA